MKAILRIKAWQIFMILILYVILTVVTSIFKLSIRDLSTIQMHGFLRIIGLIIFTLWLFFVGLELNRTNNNPHKFNNLILAIASLSFLLGYASLNITLFPKLDAMIPLLFQFLSIPITLFGLMFLFYNIPMSLKSIELGKKAKYSECVLEALLFFSCAIGIGVWWLQPRMNRIEKINKK
jgi:hypothetical protein